MGIVFDICLCLPKGSGSLSPLSPHSGRLCFFQRGQSIKSRSHVQFQTWRSFLMKIQILSQCFIEVTIMAVFPSPIFLPALAAVLSLLLSLIRQFSKQSVIKKMFSCLFQCCVRFFKKKQRKSLAEYEYTKQVRATLLSLKRSMRILPPPMLAVFLFIPPGSPVEMSGQHWLYRQSHQYT